MVLKNMNICLSINILMIYVINYNIKVSRLEYANFTAKNLGSWEGIFTIQSNQDNLNQAVFKDKVICI